MALALLDLVAIVDNSPYAGVPEGTFRFLAHDDVLLGKIAPMVVPALEAVQFLHVDRTARTVRVVDPADLSGRVAALCAEWRAQHTFKCLDGWRNELYTVYTTGGVRYFEIERSAAALFGLVTYGVHITGYDPVSKRVWVPRRSYSKPTYPGMLDNTVAGGLGDGLGFWETAVKECGEEAGLSPAYVEKNLRPTGVVSYEFIDPATGYFQPEVECVYDLAMPEGVTPCVTDGEVHEFMLLECAEVLARMRAGEFKYNTAVVLLDFFVRHGLLSVEADAGYLEIVARSHRRLEYPLAQVAPNRAAAVPSK